MTRRVPRLLSRLLESSADRWPERPAVVHGERELTYAALDACFNQVAALLAGELGVRRGDRVGIYMEKSLQAVVAIHGTLKAGAAYVPLDPRAPVARLGHLVDDCGLRCLLTSRERLDRCPPPPGGAAGRGVPLVTMDAPAAGAAPAGWRLLGTEALDPQPTASRPPRAIDMDLAYILYTSGSTGRPKGVMHSHRSALAFVEWAAETFGVTPDDRLSSHAPFHFDLSIFDLYAATLGGAATVLLDHHASMLPVEVAGAIDGQRITIWYSVPSILALLARRGGLRGGELPSLRAVLFAGEVFHSKHLRRLMTLLPHATFHNLFGPTETNVCTYHRVAAPPAETDPIPIGGPVADVELYVVGAGGGLAGTGEVGELLVRGATLMSGYWGDEERTSRSLVGNRWVEGARDPVYRTGDLVRRDSNGDLWFVGRRDDQVKSRGHRIELGDVESALVAHPAVEECAVVPVPDDMVSCRLLACVVGGDELTADALRRHCAEWIPRYMIPEWFDLRPSLPRTSSGKVDRKALLEEAVAAPRPGR